jgi:hypothetical protein
MGCGFAISWICTAPASKTRKPDRHNSQATRQSGKQDNQAGKTIRQARQSGRQDNQAGKTIRQNTGGAGQT